MKSDFNWQTEENEWDQDPVPEKTVTKRYFWTYLIGLLFLLFIVTIFTRQRLNLIAESPNQLIELTCQAEEIGTTANYWYDPARKKWLDKTQLFDSDNISSVTALDENSFLLEEIIDDQDGPHWRLSLWQDKNLSLLVDVVTRRKKTLNITDPTHRKLIFTEPDPASGVPRFYLLDLDACQTGECHLTPLPGPVIWSPDGARSLITNLDEGEFPLTLFLGNSATVPEREIGAGFARAWIDNERFIYQPSDQPDDNEIQLIVSNLVGETLAILNTADMANFFLPPASEFSPQNINSVKANPLNPDELLVTAFGVDVRGNERAGLIFRYNWRTNTYQELHVTPDPFPNIQISPDGRWLIIHKSASAYLPGHPSSTLLDLTTGQKQNIDEETIFPSNDVWSADNQWLLSLHPDLLYMINPVENTQQAVPLPNAPCLSAKWIPTH